MRVIRAAYALSLLLLSSVAYAAADAGAADEALPISVNAKPAVVFVGRPVTLSGDSIPTPKLSTVTLNVKPDSGNTPAPVEYKLVLDGGGQFSQIYTPSAAGSYQVTATAPDGRGHAQTSFQVQSAAAPSADTVNAIVHALTDSKELIDAMTAAISNLPANPAKDDLLKALATLQQPMQQLLSEANGSAKLLQDLLRLSDGIRLGAGQQAQRDSLLSSLATAEQARARTKQILNNVKNHRTSCDDLEVVVEGFKWAGVLFNFAVSNPSSIAENFGKDILGAFTSGTVQSAGGDGAAQFASTETVKSISFLSAATGKFQMLHFDSNTIVSRVNDFAGLAATQTMEKYCVTIAGPVKAHMHAEFYQDGGAKWWEYSFDLIAKLTLHYPRSASGDQIPVNGRMEGYGTNFTIWENALAAQYPELMSSTVEKKIVIKPVSIPATASGALPSEYSTEGSVFGALVTPNAFFFQTTGMISKDKLQFTVGAVRTDQSPKARVIAILVPVLTLGIPNLASYSLPYKDAHFVFERTADNVFEIPLKTSGQTIRGQKHFENERGGVSNKGNYSVDVRVCNPGC